MITKYKRLNCLLIFFSSLLLVACKGEILGRIDGRYEDKAKSSEEVIEVVENKEYIHADNIIKEKEQFTEYSREGNQSKAVAEYQIKEVNLMPSFRESGLDDEDLVDSLDYCVGKEVSSVKKEELLNSSILVVTMKVKNINHEDFSIGGLYLVYDKKEEGVCFSATPAYVEGAKEREESQFYHLNLLKGEERELKVGWYLNKDD
ncbi:MAG TPA: DUF5027 family lipoprotein, partial [Lachnospiraceae bacterium]